MRILAPIISTAFILLTTLTVSGQNTHKADNLYDRMGYQLAIDNYGDSDDISLKQRIRLAESHRLNGHSENAEILYRTILSVDKSPIHYLHFAQALLMNNKVDEAMSNFKIYKSHLSADNRDNRADNYINFILSESFAQFKNIEIENTSSINTDNFEFSPFIINDGLLFISSRSHKNQGILASTKYTDFVSDNSLKDKWTKKDYNKIYKSVKGKDGTFSQTALLSETLSAPFHQGPLHINADEDLLYFTSSHTLDGIHHREDNNVIPLQIYKAIIIDDEWSTAIPFKEINTPDFNEAHPTLTKNGQTIIFTSDREDGYGGMDLYIAHKVDGQWMAPVNMGDKVNTAGNEIFPFIHQSGKLYFSSDGHGGFGGLDIFEVDINEEGMLTSAPINSGAPLNSNKDDFGYNSTSDDQSGYFSSARSTSLGRDDVFHFERGEEVEEEPEEEEEEEIVVEEEIETIIKAPVQEWKEIIEPEVIIAQPVITDPVVIAEPTVIFDNAPIVEGVNLTLDKIYYAFDKANLLDESLPELNKLADFLNQFPDVTIELGAHTDSRGRSTYNEQLSQRRAESVVSYLAQQNIAAHRIIAKGYGESQLRNNCLDGIDCSEEEHQYNRRTEFKVLNVGSNANLTYTNNGPTSVHPKTIVTSNAGTAPERKSGPTNYSNVNTASIASINAELQTEGSFQIVVGVYANPSLKISKMKNLGFDKTYAQPVDHYEGQNSVIIGSVHDSATANRIHKALKALGVKNSILKID